MARGVPGRSRGHGACRERPADQVRGQRWCGGKPPGGSGAGISCGKFPAALAFWSMTCKGPDPAHRGFAGPGAGVDQGVRARMKVTLERNHLLRSLSHVHRVVERRNTYPILANVLFKAADDRVELRATDLDIEVTESVPAMVSTPGSTTVPAH